MKKALVDLFSSKKFLTLIAGLVVAGVARFGVQADPETIVAILSLFAVLIGAQGATDFGKEAAKSSTPPKEGGFFRLEISVLLLAIGLVGCAWLKSEGKATIKSGVDCTISNRAQLTNELGAAMDQLLLRATSGDGHVDKAAMKDAAKSFAIDTGMCVLADAFTRAMSPKSATPSAPQLSPVEVSPDELAALFDEIRRERAPGVKYHTRAGDI
jgi:hypothetical protein